MSELDVRITFVRHGESLANHAQRFQGQGDSPLSELGHTQARALAKRLACHAFDLVVSSDLARAVDTARALGVPFERDPALREFDVGAWEGLTRAEVSTRFAAELARLDAGEEVAFGGGESYPSFCARVDGAVERLRAALQPGQRALVVCHGGVIGALFAGVLGLRGRRDVPIGRVFNSALSELSFSPDGRARMLVYNDSLHLAELGMFPHAADMAGAIGLVCGSGPSRAHGTFASMLEAEVELARGAAESLLHAGDVRSWLGQLALREPLLRTAVSASAERIHGWVSGLLFEQELQHALLAPPEAGTLCHLSARAGRVALIDYGLAAEP